MIPLRREVVPIRRQGRIVTYKTTFSGVMNVGWSSQSFRVVFDTGSGHVVVPDTACRSDACLIHKRLNLSASTGMAIDTFGNAVRPWEKVEVSIGFGTGLIRGRLIKDRVCMGAAVAGRECVEMHLLTAVDMSDNPFFSFDIDGIVGLGLPMLALTDEFSFFHVLSRTRGFASLQYAFFLTDDDHDDQSELTIGGHNPDRTLTPLSWSPVLRPDEGHWLVAIRAVRVDGQLLAGICEAGDCQAVVDTGSSHIGVPVAYKDVLYDALARDAGDFLDCRLTASSVLEFELDSINLTLTPADYMRRIPLREDIDVGGSIISEQGDNAAEYLTEEESADSGVDNSHLQRFCGPRLMAVHMPAPLGPNLFILGEPIVQRYYTVYDWSKLSVGFGLANKRRNTAQPETGRGSLPADLAEEGHLLLQRQSGPHARSAAEISIA